VAHDLLQWQEKENIMTTITSRQLCLHLPYVLSDTWIEAEAIKTGNLAAKEQTLPVFLEQLPVKDRASALELTKWKLFKDGVASYDPLCNELYIYIDDDARHRHNIELPLFESPKAVTPIALLAQWRNVKESVDSMLQKLNEERELQKEQELIEGEQFDKEMNRWILHYGSDHLKKVHDENTYNYKGIYVQERAHKDFPGLVVVKASSIKLLERANPTKGAFKVLSSITDQTHGAYQLEIAWIGPVKSTSKKLELLSYTEVVVIKDYLPGYILLHPVLSDVAVEEFEQLKTRYLDQGVPLDEMLKVWLSHHEGEYRARQAYHLMLPSIRGGAGTANIVKTCPELADLYN
jgi:hypothetical protein